MLSQNKLLETIKCLDGTAFNLGYHQKRVDRSRVKLGLNDGLELELSPPKKGLYRCRIIYEDEIEQLEYIPYQQKEIKSFKLINSTISYPLKYENRDDLNALFKQRNEADEIIIVKNGLVTDTTIANLCFFDGIQWLTPKTPLLEGTTRQRYLDTKTVKTADIYAKDLHKYSKIAMMNAMIDFYIIENVIIV